MGFERTGRRAREGDCDALFRKALVLMAAGLRIRGGWGLQGCFDDGGWSAVKSAVLRFSLKDGCIRKEIREGGSDALLFMAIGLSRRGLCVSEG